MSYVAGFTNGANVASNYRKETDNRKQLHQQMAMQQQNQDIALREKGYDKNGGIIPGGAAATNDIMQQLQHKIAMQGQQINEQINQSARTDSARAAVGFGRGGNASDVNKIVRNNPALAKTLRASGVHTVGDIDFTKDADLLASQGLTPEMYDTDEKKEMLTNSFWKYFNGDTWELGDVNAFLAQSGTYKNLLSEEQNEMSENYSRTLAMIQGVNVVAQERAAAKEAALKEKAQANDDVRTGVAVMNADTNRLNAGKAPTSRLTSTQKNLAAADNKYAAFEALVGGKEAVLALDFNDPEVFNKYGSMVKEILTLQGVKMPNNMREDIKEFNQTAAAATKVSGSDDKKYGGVGLTEAQTGVFDSTVNTMLEYATDETAQSSDIKSAFATLRNVYIKTFAGSVVTEAEAVRMNNAFAPLGKKHGAVLGSLLNYFENVRAGAVPLQKTLGPLGAAYYTGSAMKKLDKAIAAIEQSIAIMDRVGDNTNAKNVSIDAAAKQAVAQTGTQPVAQPATAQPAAAQPVQQPGAPLDEIPQEALDAAMPGGL